MNERTFTRSRKKVFLFLLKVIRILEKIYFVQKEMQTSFATVVDVLGSSKKNGNNDNVT